MGDGRFRAAEGLRLNPQALRVLAMRAQVLHEDIIHVQIPGAQRHCNSDSVSAGVTIHICHRSQAPVTRKRGSFLRRHTNVNRERNVFGDTVYVSQAPSWRPRGCDFQISDCVRQRAQESMRLFGVSINSSCSYQEAAFAS